MRIPHEQTYIAVTRADGSMAIMGFLTVGHGSTLPSHAEWLSKEDGVWRREPTDAAIFEEISRAMPDATGYHRIAVEDIPADRSYRDAWRHDGKTLHHDMNKARAIHLDGLRRERAARMDALDVDWMRAVAADVPEAAKSIETRRQTLRDMPQLKSGELQKAKTIEDLKKITLE